jgi:5-(carboxyamino)imidazole ribonucleotide mutase
MSAHRTPERVVQYVRSARENGLEVLIACAGMAAHLAGVVAAHTTLPVIGVPLAGGLMNGLDALLSTVQMPSGIPVATVAVDGTKNAAYLAARMLAGTHPELVARIEAQLDADRARYGA